MKRSGPLFTLLGGLLLALLLLTLNATTGEKTTPAGDQAPPTPNPTASPSPRPSAPPTSEAPTPTPTPTKTQAPDADYAGRTDDDSSAIAVTVRDGKAVAYFCDGRNRESWLKGDVAGDGSMKLTGKNGATLEAAPEGDKLTGTAKVDKKTFAFTADRAKKPSGLYRATQTVRGARLDGGWIVLPNGDQVGILTRDGTREPAPEIDPASGSVTGEDLTARPVTP
ncbi:hypothetical protein H9Y04_22305 [Streptomyces sp. TRM66268-LWL]|uniref:Serine/threonine protein kinase n=1 Tax=Streptomyces polyasparticus TaxID=2767826 RepID=A0ABR7SL10_9ACTN|nr:hypothetical protein [Streptomyces polyasparticus]MBC9715287.1 hypothetical protein [Streptomyces polyasparticus]